MSRPDSATIVPLIDVALANRDRLIERERRSSGADALMLRRSIIRIDRWLVEFAYERTAPDYWTR
jgi:hypothetical protein